MLLPRINFEFIDDYIIDNKKISVIKIPSATHTPISYKNEIYLRIGSNNKLAKEYPEKLRILWNKTSGFNYEEIFCVAENCQLLSHLISVLLYPYPTLVKDLL